MSDSVRFSHLRAYGRSAMHGHHARFGPDAKQSRPMQLGSAVHAIIGGHKTVCGYPGKVRRGSEYDAFVAAHQDAEILTLSEYDKAQRMADEVRKSSLAMKYLAGEHERTLLFHWMGLECRATPDVRSPDYITELKTASTSDPMRFTGHALRMAYHAQMRMQQIACNDGSLPCFVVCVESERPHPVTVFRFTDRALEIGDKLLTLWAERLHGCELSGEWPPYAQGVVPLDVPDEIELDFGGGDDILEPALGEQA